jgi:hypothetical protein
VDEYAKDLVKSMIGPTLGPAIDAIIRRTLKSLVGRAHYSLEMKAIADRSKMDLGRLVLLQHIYEASACCTSIVLDGEKSPIHIRCMDWGMDILKPLTIEIDCRKGGQTVFIGTTWAGFLGVFTGMRPGEWSCSLNFRVTSEGSFWKNLKSAMKGSTPSGFLMRYLLESEPSYDAAVEKLAKTSLVAPCYFSICGALPGQGALVTRNPNGEEHRWNISELGHFVQTNIDHWSFEDSEDVMNSIRRREVALAHLDKRPSTISDDWLWKMMSVTPILNDITIYGTLMIPAESKLETRLPSERSGYRARSDYQPQDGIVLVPSNVPHDEYLRLVTVPMIAAITCSVCTIQYGPYINLKGQCSHFGHWHSTFNDCSYLSCGIGLLPNNVGKRHWSCCFSLDSESAICSKSGAHIPPLPAAEDEALLDEDE